MQMVNHTSTKTQLKLSAKSLDHVLDMSGAKLHGNADPIGPAVSLDGYPRYTPQWGEGLPENRKAGPPTPVRKEPSDRAKAVMTRPGTPAYPKAVGNGPKAAPSREAQFSSTSL